jgi:two-component system response regulator (stage 0 sporulation protein F)
MPTVLLIDDDPAVRAAIAAILKRGKFGVFVAPEGSTGLDVFNSARFDAVVVDIFMPDMDGIATIRQLRAANPTIPIIAISGHAITNKRAGAPDFLGMAVKLGATCALQKPFHPNQLFDAVNKCLAAGGTPARSAEPVRTGKTARTTSAAAR